MKYSSLSIYLFKLIEFRYVSKFCDEFEIINQLRVYYVFLYLGARRPQPVLTSHFRFYLQKNVYKSKKRNWEKKKT